ncbi:MAG: hypothetical protein IH988_00310 [Planctomycetes bacterium]|nr:hypothetical protein [Planctomycetota bacterium]
MFNRIVNVGAAVLMAGGLCWGEPQALADGHEPTLGRPHLSTGPGLQGIPLLPRGGGGSEVYAGDPECVPIVNNGQVGITGPFVQECGDGQWVSLAYPVLTSASGLLESISIVHNSNTGVGDLYLMGDCGGNPDTNAILWAGCGCIQGTVSGAVTNYCLGDPIFNPPAVVWVVATFATSFSFDIAYDSTTATTGAAYANFDGGGNCGDWDDLDIYSFGFCYWVSIVENELLLDGDCCCSPALCDGDVNGDGVVDPLDGGYILARFGLDASDSDHCAADVNCDGVINPLDSGYLLARFGLCNEPEQCSSECDGCFVGCGVPSCPVLTAHDCCEVHSEPGCNSVCGVPDDGGVEDCVCDFDSFCCEETWDGICVDLVESLGCADCSETNPDCVE